MEEEKVKVMPIINAHAHVFTSSHIPPLLGKRFIPFPFYYFVHLDFVLGIYKFFNKIRSLYYENWHRNIRKYLYRISITIRRNIILNFIKILLVVWIVVLSFYFLYDWIHLLFNIAPSNETYGSLISEVKKLLLKFHLLPGSLENIWKILIVLILILFIKSGRNLIFLIFKNIFSFFRLLPGKKTKELLDRYLLIAKYAKYKKQTQIFSKMKDQYPEGSGFILLPMDMKYMNAGKCKNNYEEQLEELKSIKESDTYKNQGVKIYPFIFIDPRRIREDRMNNNKKLESHLFNYKHENGTIKLESSLSKTYIEDHGFRGFKIYPAIGYFPFEKELLPLWKYAADNGIPIMSHCIKGTIFYRGRTKLKEWDNHLVFKDEDGNKPLLMSEVKNINYQKDFTHPMNFLCLLEEPFLRILLEKYDDCNLHEIFGFVDSETPLEKDLRNLKICFAHYGGEDQWNKYLEKDGYSYSQQVIKKPGEGIEFIKRDEDSQEINYIRLAQIWKYVDWYSIISSMMMHYPHVYADISYILHDKKVFPLLKETLKPRYKKLRNRVLFGTDFYVVRNHNSEKDLFITSDSELSNEEFDLIARINPSCYLNI